MRTWLCRRCAPEAAALQRWRSARRRPVWRNASGRYRSKCAMMAMVNAAAETATMTTRGEQSVLRTKRIGLPPFFILPCLHESLGQRSSPNLCRCAPTARCGSSTRIARRTLGQIVNYFGVVPMLVVPHSRPEPADTSLAHFNRDPAALAGADPSPGALDHTPPMIRDHTPAVI